MNTPHTHRPFQPSYACAAQIKWNIDVIITSMSLQRCTSGSSPVIMWYVYLALQFCLVKHRSNVSHWALGFETVRTKQPQPAYFQTLTQASVFGWVCAGTLATTAKVCKVSRDRAGWYVTEKWHLHVRVLTNWGSDV